METVTRIDEDLQDYFRMLQEKEYARIQDIQRLLDAYCKKFGVDFVYIGEMLASYEGIFFIHSSYSGEHCNFTGKTFPFQEGWDAVKAAYGQDNLSCYDFLPDPCGCGISSLHYGILVDGNFIGDVGMVDCRKRREWTDEERIAVKSLGRVVRNVLYVGMGKQVDVEEIKRQDEQSRILEAMFSSTDCGMMRHALDGSRIISINRAALDILGYESEEEMMADGFSMIANSVLDEDKGMLRATIKKLRRAGDSTSVSYRVRHKDGTLVNVFGKMRLLEENGELICQRFLLDLTDQKAMEEKEYLAEKQKHEEMIQALSVDYGSVYYADIDTGMAVSLRLNADIDRRYGSMMSTDFPLEAALERYVQDVVYEPDKELLLKGASLKRFRTDLEEKESCYTTYRAIRDGEVEYFQMKAARAGSWEQSRHIVVGFRSVDEEIRHDMAQKRLVEDSYKVILALSSDYNFIALINREDRSMSVYKASPERLEVLEALGDKNDYYDAVTSYAKYVYEDDKEKWFAATKFECVLENLENKDIYNVEVRGFFGGKIEYTQFRFAKVLGEGNDFQVVLAKRIITEIVEREVKQRTLLENALVQAERANMAKSTFLSNMSHDIRTPMNAIIGFTALATTHIDQKERVREYLGKIMSSGNHLLSLINDVLDMSRIESGKIRIEEKPCSLPEILHELRNILQSDIVANQLEFYIDTVDVVNEQIYCDRLRLNQVFLNLLGNAIKFTSAGGMITVRIIEKPCPMAGHASYEFRVKDTGIGMSEEFMEHIFEPFERERNSTISGIQGTGLGMAITKNIVDMMNGTIQVKSEQGKGTEFTVALTFRLQSLSQPLRAIPELKGCHALVVDDDFNTCDSVTGMLQQIGMRSEWTMSGREALLRTRQALARKDEYRVYIVDWLMPDVNGIELTRRIRSEVGNDAPIIVLTAYDWADIEAEAREAGVTTFCSKPLFLSELRECLQAVISPKCKKEENAAAKETERKKGRILLAEDNELNREIATELLTEAGFMVEAAENGQAAVRMLAESEPGYYRLILMDVQMPVMDGYGATREIRKLKDPELASIPILAMTANAFEEDKQEALASGMDGHIAKPINVEKLFETLEEVLGE